MAKWDVKKHHEDKESLVFTGKHYQHGGAVHFRVAKFYGSKKY